MKKCSKEIWQGQMNLQDLNKNLTVQKVHEAVLKGAFAIREVENNRINLENNKDITVKKLTFELSNGIKFCTDSLIFLGMANMEWYDIRRQHLSNFYRQSCSPLLKISLYHQNTR